MGFEINLVGLSQYFFFLKKKNRIENRINLYSKGKYCFIRVLFRSYRCVCFCMCAHVCMYMHWVVDFLLGVEVKEGPSV